MRYLLSTLTIIFFLQISQSQQDYKSWNSFLTKYVLDDGKVNYTAISQNKNELDQVISDVSKIQSSSLTSKDEQLAYWINIYNIYTIKLIIDNYPITSIKNLDNGKTWDIKRITLQGKKYSLNDIENNIIRPTFKDARIHFAVNCGAKSCPPLHNRAFTGKTLNSQLDQLAKKFINNKSFMTLSPGKITISKIFEWYKTDFNNIIAFINKYSTIKVNNNAQILYQTYDWSLNKS
jgi:hypothetical protein